MSWSLHHREVKGPVKICKSRCTILGPRPFNLLIDSEQALGTRGVGKESRFGDPVALRLEFWNLKGVCDRLSLANREHFGRAAGGI
jgi:hypothetical protein